jgi:hypothetical protein
MDKILGFSAKCAVLACALAATAGIANAQERRELDPKATPQVVERLFACREIAEPTERLACFDREVAVVEQATSSDDLVIADREQISEARKGLFGFSIPKLRLFDRGSEKDEALDQIEGVIASTRLSANGKLVVILEDGARWIQTDDTPIPGTVRPGDRIVIKRAAIGSFFARIGTKRSFRTQRLN